MCATWRLCPWREEACSPLALLAGWNMDTWWVILNQVNEETPGWQSNKREEAWLLTTSQPGLPSCPDSRFLTCFLTSTVVSQGSIVIVSMLVSITRLWTPYEDLSPYFQFLTVAPELLWVLAQKRPLWMFIEWMNVLWYIPAFDGSRDRCVRRTVEEEPPPIWNVCLGISVWLLVTENPNNSDLQHSHSFSSHGEGLRVGDFWTGSSAIRPKFLPVTLPLPHGANIVAKLQPSCLCSRKAGISNGERES